MKVGALPLARELELLARHAQRLSARTASSCAWTPTAPSIPPRAWPTLEQFARFDVAFLEQPHPPPGTGRHRRALPPFADSHCAGRGADPGRRRRDARSRLLDTIRPQHLILKPALLGGFTAADEWIADAEARGHSVVDQFAVGIQHRPQRHLPVDRRRWAASRIHGLGTGGLFTNNFPSPIRLVGNQAVSTTGNLHGICPHHATLDAAPLPRRRCAGTVHHPASDPTSCSISPPRRRPTWHASSGSSPARSKAGKHYRRTFWAMEWRRKRRADRLVRPAVPAPDRTKLRSATCWRARGGAKASPPRLPAARSPTASTSWRWTSSSASPTRPTWPRRTSCAKPACIFTGPGALLRHGLLSLCRGKRCRQVQLVPPISCHAPLATTYAYSRTVNGKDAPILPPIAAPIGLRA